MSRVSAIPDVPGLEIPRIAEDFFGNFCLLNISLQRQSIREHYKGRELNGD